MKIYYLQIVGTKIENEMKQNYYIHSKFKKKRLIKSLNGKSAKPQDTNCRTNVDTIQC